MRNVIRSMVRSISCNRSALFLAAAWCAGLFSGTCLASGASPSFLLLTRSAVSTPASVVGLCTAAYLPFLLAALAVFLRRYRLLYAICFCKALLFAWSGSCVLAVFGSAGWLVRLLYQFSDLFFVPVLCWFSLRHISGLRLPEKRRVLFLMVLAVAVGSLDYCLVSPYLVRLIN